MRVCRESQDVTRGMQHDARRLSHLALLLIASALCVPSSSKEPMYDFSEQDHSTLSHVPFVFVTTGVLLFSSLVGRTAPS